MLPKLIKNYANSNILGKLNQYYKLFKKVRGGLTDLVSVVFGIPELISCLLPDGFSILDFFVL